ncbi:MAG: RnfABCDGE type electron transport complex subunit B [Bacillota bacterium]|nr:RnfABCDGE type electron transport complex subunit B [Bacillota bacterium]
MAAGVIWSSIGTMALIGLVLGLGLTYASRRLAVERDPRVDQIEQLLPGANCGACGYAGCRQMAEEMAAGRAPAAACVAGGSATAAAIAEILGVEAGEVQERVAVLLCGGGAREASRRSRYLGVQDCLAAQLVAGGPKACAYGCLGYGTCVRACPFGAIRLNDDALPEIDRHKCTGCGKCAEACPRHLIVLADRASQVFVACSSQARGAEVRKVCTVGCIGCQLCVRECPQGAITVENNLARIDQERCTRCGSCLSRCPTHCLVAVTELTPCQPAEGVVDWKQAAQSGG